ncbi:NADH-cytochrome b5 reductase-like protein [Diplonema papillatum]|nr:NADH-cytochrome b5 reductase-like protein [Diplonema papillatum]|eukprot:gene2139-3280_t
MFRTVGRVCAGSAFGIVAGWAMKSAGPVSADQQVDDLELKAKGLVLPGLSGRVWPPEFQLEEPVNTPLPEKSPAYFADSAVASDPTKGPLTSMWKQFRLEEVLPVNHNTAKFIFSFSDPDIEYSLPPCSTLELGLKLPGSNVAAHRLYTPITPNKTKGGFECIVKVYQQGCFTPSLFKLKPGDTIWARVQHLKMKYKRGDYDFVGCIAGGTGIAPMLQIIRAVLSDPEDPTKVSLLFSNRRSCDILLKSELDALQKFYPERFSVTYCLQEPPLGWEGEVGRVSHAMVARTMPPPDSRCCVCLSGPDKMMEAVGGCSAGNMAFWRNTNDGVMPALRAKQVSSPTANSGAIMMSGILFECGYTQNEVYRF